jgi:signal transduction histidine kinase
LGLQEQHVHKTRAFVRGRPRWFNLHKAAIEPLSSVYAPEHGSFWGGIVLLIEDLTEVHTLEAELTHSERLASIGRLAAGVAHEIGNPVTGIACLTQNLRFEDDPTIVEESLAEILLQTRRISDILQSLSTFSHGGLPEGQRFTLFNLIDCIGDAQRLVKLSRDGKYLDYIMPCGEPLVIEADRQRLLQVLVNLLSNACDASQPGGRIEVTAEIEGSQVVLAVVDQGEGIPHDLRERIFEPFFTTKDPGKGTGLGLPLVYTIIRDHGGGIDIDAEPNGGTRVLVRLPLRQQSTNEIRAVGSN